LEQEVATVLAGGPSPQLAAGAPGAPGTAAPPAPPTVFTGIAAGACFVFAFAWLLGFVVFSGRMGPGSFNGLFWILLGVAALLVHLDEKKAHDAYAQSGGGAPAAAPGPGAIIGAVGAVLMALSALLSLITFPFLDAWILHALASVA